MAILGRMSDGTWEVPSMSGNGKYIVNPKVGTCTCPDCEKGNKCKHIFAVEVVMKRQTTRHADGSTTVTESVSISATKRPTYTQDWPAYNAAQTNEQDEFQNLLRDLCSSIRNAPQSGRGRPKLPMSDVIFAAVFKVYSTMSGRRFTSDLRNAHEDGTISTMPHYNSIFRYLENIEMTPILNNMIAETAKPLAAIESDFAADSTGFASSRFVRWFDHKYGVVKQSHDWVKVHIMCGVKTNVVTAVEIHERNAHDSVQLPALLETTAKNFKMMEVSCDKGYSDRRSHDAIAQYGATPFINFKKCSADGQKGVWGKMYHFFKYKQDEFMAHYHKRSNVESTFSMIKAKFGDAVRSKTDVAMKNEALCKLLAHNICCLISAMYELGIDPKFQSAA